MAKKADFQPEIVVQFTNSGSRAVKSPAEATEQDKYLYS